TDRLLPECFAPTGRGTMKTQGLEARFSQNLAPVSRNKTLKPLPRLYFTIIQQALISRKMTNKNRSLAVMLISKSY
ncbi:MAG: hypothetical protein ACKPJP_12880, partial [Microcystis panniformis]